MIWITQVATRTRIHRAHHHKPRRIRQRNHRPRNGHKAVFYGLTQVFEHATIYEGFTLTGSMTLEMGIPRQDYYKVGDVCKLLKINEKTYRNWENAGRFPKARRNPVSGYRVFNEEELKELQRLFRAKARRFKGKGRDSG